MNVEFKLGILTHWIGLIVVSCLPSLVCLIYNIKFDGVITSGDGFHIPVDETQSLLIVDVINVKNTEEKNEKNNCQTHNLDFVSVVNVIGRDFTRNLKVEI